MSLINRRSLLGGLAVTAFAPGAASAAMARPASGSCCGCMQGSTAFAASGPVSSARASADGGVPDPALTSGDAATDELLGLALVGLAAAFKVNPGFIFYDDTSGANARATADTVMPGTWGTVAMGRRFFNATMRLGDRGLTVIAVCAHEFGHIHQMQRGYQDDLLKRDATVRPIELHADFLAGFFLASRKQEHPDLDLFTVGETFSRMGDTDFRGRGHHGTPEERTAAISAGFELGTKGQTDIERAAAAGRDYVVKVL